MGYTKIKDILQLKELLKGKESIDCFIHLGAARSSKTIFYHKDYNTFDVFNEIDDTWEEELSEEKLMSGTSTGTAIEKGKLYLH